MIGAWCRFGEGPLPSDGEAIAFVKYGEPEIENFGRVLPEIEMAIYRNGRLYTQSGIINSIPYGSWWTSIPPPSIRA